MLPFRLETRSINWKGTLCFKCTFSRSSSHMLWNGTLVSNQHVKWWIKPNFKLLLDNCFKKSIKCSIQTISGKVFPYFLQGNSKLWIWHSGRKISWWILFFVWLTDERRLALFPAETIFRDPHHRESLTHCE